ncbi:hypothetical protein Sta7437_0838 [Stanieria cyanosphaera PCC 7437]|uniref:Uncharacterized protein n=1 Tax=Stanieria cyanosphaera (strain ATCC 29371 / PCC 7437) TaxID=111780 RepID=K9XQU0_STAC7|nr:hypothetical protein [Stanieria cyanosphaera]AFZ34426.1 hypothetical protein Sta7437_0838 [Stanieria cyanosphaera PCC 7437]
MSNIILKDLNFLEVLPADNKQVIQGGKKLSTALATDIDADLHAELTIDGSFDKGVINVGLVGVSQGATAGAAAGSVGGKAYATAFAKNYKI